MRKALFIILVLTSLFSYGQGVFYDFTTKQVGAFLRQEIAVSDPVTATVGLRHQKDITRVDLMIGSNIQINRRNPETPFIGFSLGVSFPFQEFSGPEPHITGLASIRQPIGRNLGLYLYYQPTRNHSLILKRFQHQVGGGAFITMN